MKKKSNSKKRKYVKPAEKPLQEARGGVVINAILWSAFFVAILSFLLTPVRMNEAIPADYGPGMAARADIRAPRDIRFVDREATQAKKLEAGREVRPVYDFDPSVMEKLRSDVQEVFMGGRSAVGRHLGAGSRTNGVRRRGAEPSGIAGNGSDHKAEYPPELLAVFRPLFDPLSSEDPKDVELAAFIHDRFSPALERETTGALEDALDQGYLGGQYLADDAVSSSVALRDLRTGDEREVRFQQIVNDATDLQRRLRNYIRMTVTLPESDAQQIASYLSGVVKPNLLFNNNLTQQRRLSAQAEAGIILVEISKGTLIVRKGEEITPSKWAALQRLRETGMVRRTSLLFFLGTATAITLLVLAQWYFLRRHPRFERHHRSIHFLTLLITLMSLMAAKLYFFLASLIGESVVGAAWVDDLTFKVGAPLAVGGMLVALLADVQIGFLFSILFALLLGYLVEGNTFLMFYAFMGNVATLYGLGLSRQKHRAALWKASFVLSGANCLLIMVDALRTLPPPSYGVVLGHLAFGLIGALAFTLPVVYVATFLLETIFGITTDMRLLELSSTNEPLLRELQIKAPGTFQHSLMTANLAEPAAEAIGANPLLARAGSLYHDVGKTHKPEYFIENQAEGLNPHEKLAPSMSALILISHVKDGLDLAKEYKLPPAIRDIIGEHHGTKLIRFFYEKARENWKPEQGELNESDYRYPGPKPQTREAAIILLADAVEAASRTLTEPSPAKIQGLVKKIMETSFADQQLDDSDLTLRDLERISGAFLRVLASFHHQRVDYPGFQFETLTEYGPPTGAGLPAKLIDWRLARKRKMME